MDDMSRWTVAEGVHEDFPLLIRYRTDVLEDQFKATPDLVKIIWEMQYASSTGLPDAKDHLALDQFEAFLESSIEAPGVGKLYVVVTTGGVRDFYLYVGDVQEFIDKFHSADNSRYPYPIRLEVNRGENGDFYREILASCSE